MTTPIVPDLILGLFQNEINKINLDLLEKVCQIYKINYQEAVERLKNELKVNLVINKDERIKIVKTRPELNSNERCIARCFKRSDLDLVQCTLRHYPDKNFCKRHQNMFDNGTLKFGTINDEIMVKDKETRNKTEAHKIDPNDRCIARLSKRSDLDDNQCNLRHCPNKEFCKRHQRMFENGILKFGTINEEPKIYKRKTKKTENA